MNNLVLAGSRFSRYFRHKRGPDFTYLGWECKLCARTVKPSGAAAHVAMHERGRMIRKTPQECLAERKERETK